MADLISRQVAIDAINELHDKPNAWLDLAVEALEKLPSAQPETGKWMPCSERLPEKGKVVLITNEKGNVRCGQYRGVWSFYERPTEWVWRGNTVETVIAWRYLPEPYEAEK